MGVPLTTGQLRTKVSDMQIGDYISLKWDSSGSYKFTNLGATVPTNGETPLSGSSTITNGYFYLTKIAKGLLASDRVIQHTVTWDTLNSNKVIQGLPWNSGNIIPTMTSNNSPSGVASSSNPRTTEPPYYAFDKNTTAAANAWVTNGITGWLQYDFPTAKLIKGYAIYPQLSLLTRSPKDWTFEAWDDETAQWVILDTQRGQTGWTNSVKKTFTIFNDKAFSKYRINVSANSGDTTYLAIQELEMFDQPTGTIRSLTGGVAYASYPSAIPAMTGYTSPSGVASAKKESVSSEAWKAFDRNTGTSWSSYDSVSPSTPTWLMYDFGTPTKIGGYGISCSMYANNAPKDWTFEGSDDGISWTVLHQQTGNTLISSNISRFSFSNTKAFKKYRINITTNSGANAAYVTINDFEMYDITVAANSSTTDQGFGAFPANNEWDKYIVNFPVDKIQAGKTLDDVWHWSGTCQTWMQDTPILSLYGNTYRVSRGGASGTSWGINKVTPSRNSADANTSVGFRPVLEYKE